MSETVFVQPTSPGLPRRRATGEKPNLRLVHDAAVMIAWEPTVTTDAQVIGLYDMDVVLWADQQAALLRQRAANELDWNNLAEEIEDVANRHRDQIESRLATLSAHLLKWQFQPEQRSSSWRGSIVESRNRIHQVIKNYPSLKEYPEKVLADAYLAGWRVAAAETELTDLPDQCPWTIGQMLDHDFWPDNRGC